jgi:hypothetical protein
MSTLSFVKSAESASTNEERIELTKSAIKLIKIELLKAFEEFASDVRNTVEKNDKLQIATLNVLTTHPKLLRSGLFPSYVKEGVYSPKDKMYQTLVMLHNLMIQGFNMLMLQEIAEYEYPVFEKFFALFGFKGCYKATDYEPYGGMSVATFTNLSIISSETCVIGKTLDIDPDNENSIDAGRRANIALAVVVEIGGNRFTSVNYHTPCAFRHPSIMMAHFTALYAFATKFENMFIAGDFNMHADCKGSFNGEPEPMNPMFRLINGEKITMSNDYVSTCELSDESMAIAIDKFNERLDILKDMQENMSLLAPTRITNYTSGDSFKGSLSSCLYNDNALCTEDAEYIYPSSLTKFDENDESTRGPNPNYPSDHRPFTFIINAC